MSDEPKKTYKIGTISLDEDGCWWVHWAGTYLKEGELTFGARQAGGHNLYQLLNLARLNLTQCKDIYVAQIGDIEEAKKNQPAE